MVTTKGIIDGLWRGKRKCIDPQAVMRTCGSKFGKSCTFQSQKEILVHVEHVKAHRTKKDKKDMSHFEKLVTEGNEKADELAKAGAMLMLDEWCMAEARAKTMQQERREVFTALQHAASFSLFSGRMERL